MKFEFIDRIVELTRGERLVAVKAVSLAEEYLADHFPTFPVLPGVLMLQVLVEAGSWLVQEAQDFSAGVILLREAKNVVFKSFVKPGNLLKVEVLCRRIAPGESEFEGVGTCNQVEVVKARFSLTHFRLGDCGPSSAPVDPQWGVAARAKFAALRR